MKWDEPINGVKCADCTFSAPWPHYHPPMLVCRCPKVLARTGGPRSCAAIGRAPGGVCGPSGACFEAKKVPVL